MKTRLRVAKDCRGAVGNGLDKLEDAKQLALGATAIRNHLCMFRGYEEFEEAEEDRLRPGSARGVEHVLDVIDARVLDLLAEACAEVGTGFETLSEKQAAIAR